MKGSSSSLVQRSRNDDKELVGREEDEGGSSSPWEESETGEGFRGDEDLGSDGSEDSLRHLWWVVED